MSRFDWLLFGLTFASGVFIGAFIFITAFKPIYAPEGVDDSEDLAMEFSVVGKSYGGMRVNSSHPSFRLLKDGSFAFRPGSTNGEVSEPLPGTLPRALTNDLLGAVSAEQLTQYGRPVTKDCRVALDGIDYEYQIILDRVSYQLDTCTTDLPYESDLAVALESIWQYFNDPGSYEGSRGFVPLNEAAESFLQDQFRN